MKWRIDTVVAKAMYVAIVIAGLVASAAAAFKWH